MSLGNNTGRSMNTIVELSPDRARSVSENSQIDHLLPKMSLTPLAHGNTFIVLSHHKILLHIYLGTLSSVFSTIVAMSKSFNKANETTCQNNDREENLPVTTTETTAKIVDDK